MADIAMPPMMGAPLAGGGGGPRHPHAYVQQQHHHHGGGGGGVPMRGPPRAGGGGGGTAQHFHPGHHGGGGGGGALAVHPNFHHHHQQQPHPGHHQQHHHHAPPVLLPPAPINPESLRVKADSRVKIVAGAIAAKIREGKSADVDAIGAASVNQAVKAIIIARDYLVARDGGIADADLVIAAHALPTVGPDAVSITVARNPAGRVHDRAERQARVAAAAAEAAAAAAAGGAVGGAAEHGDAATVSAGGSGTSDDEGGSADGGAGESAATESSAPASSASAPPSGGASTHAPHIPEPADPDGLRIASATKPNGLAGAIAGKLRDGCASVTVTGIGPTAVLKGIKALALAEAYVRDTHTIACVPRFIDMRMGDADRTGVRFTVFATPHAGAAGGGGGVSSSGGPKKH
jgi:stage V sporulation protein SpoVS